MSKKQPIYREIQDSIMDNINSGVYGVDDMIPSEFALASSFGASRTTIRKAIDELVSKKLLYRIAGVGTFVENPSAAIRGRRIVMISQWNVNNISSEFFLKIIMLTEKYLAYCGYSMLLYQTDSFFKDEEERLKQIEEDKVRGLIILPRFTFRSESELELIRSLNVPMVQINQYSEPLQMTTITTDDFNAGYRAGEAFIKNGYRQIGFYNGYGKTSSSDADRMAGLKKCLADHGYPITESYFVANAQAITTNKKTLREAEKYDLHFSSELAQQFLENNPGIDAVLAHNDPFAVQIYHAAKKLNIKVGEQLGIISFGNYKFTAMLDTPISTFDQNIEAIVKHAADELILSINNPELMEKKHIKVKSKLIERASSQKLPII